MKNAEVIVSGCEETEPKVRARVSENVSRSLALAGALSDAEQN